MITKETEKHRHKYSKLQLVRVTKVNNPKYKGTAGDKAFIMRKCKDSSCARVDSIDYGDYKTMQERFGVLSA